MELVCQAYNLFTIQIYNHAVFERCSVFHSNAAELLKKNIRWGYRGTSSVFDRRFRLIFKDFK